MHPRGGEEAFKKSCIEIIFQNAQNELESLATALLHWKCILHNHKTILVKKSSEPAKMRQPAAP